MNKILLAVDGSDSSTKAAKKVAAMFQCLGAEITIITVIKDVDSSAVYDIPSGMSSTMSVETMQEIMDQKKEEVRELGRENVEKAAYFFEEMGMDVKKVIRSGNPADVICDFAQEGDFEMIVLADKGLGGVKRFLLGSISDKVVHHAKTSVLVVK